MINANTKTPVKGKTLGTPKNPKFTPKGKSPQSNAPKTPKSPQNNNATPKQENKSPKFGKKTPNSAKTTPKFASNKTPVAKPNLTPTKRSISESTDDSSPPKKMKMFAGTRGVKVEKSTPKPKAGQGDGDKKKRPLRIFNIIKEKFDEGNKEAAVTDLENKIKMLKAKGDLSKTAKKKLKVMERLRKRILGEEAETKKIGDLSAGQKKRLKIKKLEKAGKYVKKEKKGDKPQQKSEKTQGKAPIKVDPKTEEEKEGESSGSEYNAETEVKPGKIVKTETEGDEESKSEEEVSGDEAEEDSDEEEENEDEAEETQKGKKQNPNLQQLQENKIVTKGQSRYIVFVGNLPYDVTNAEISEHFQKAGEIRDIRIQTDKETNKPRGFAYVEFNNEDAYQRGLSLHHTFIKGRRINVLYTQGGKKKGDEQKKEVKAKNFKLQAMRDQGQLAGSRPYQNRGARRGAGRGAWRGAARGAWRGTGRGGRNAPKINGS